MNEDLQFFLSLVSKLEEHEQHEPVLSLKTPEELAQIVDLSLKQEGESDEVFKENLRKLVLHTPRTASNKFFNQLFAGRNSKAILGDLLSVVLNNGMHNYKVSGVQALVENEVINKINDTIGYPKGSTGVTAPGGSMSNLMGLLMARDRADTNIKASGVTKTMTAYTSDQAHYSVIKNIRFAGIGEENLRRIPADDQGRFDLSALKSALEKDIADGKLPFFVQATSGTTVLGAFDPIRELAELCRTYNIWLHVDGVWCGPVIFSEKYRKLIDGIELSDSFCFNPHKLLQVPIVSSIFLTRHKDQMYTSFTNEASYLYQTDTRDLNLGLRSMQCGKKNDALKLWTLWKSVGTRGIRAIVDSSFELAAVARDYVHDHQDYQLYNEGDSPNVCFNYKNYDPKEICQKLYEDGKLMVGYGSFRGDTFIRLVTVDSKHTKEDILNIFRVIEDHFE